MRKTWVDHLLGSVLVALCVMLVVMAPAVLASDGGGPPGGVTNLCSQSGGTCSTGSPPDCNGTCPTDCSCYKFDKYQCACFTS